MTRQGYFKAGLLWMLPCMPLNLRAEKPVPVIWDDFSDGKLQGRTGTDPWGRPLPDWSVEGTWRAVPGEAHTDGGWEDNLATPCNVTTGTWRFRYHYRSAPDTSTYHVGSYFKFIKGSNGATLFLSNPADGHWWLGYTLPSRTYHSYPYVNMVGSQIGHVLAAGTAWHEVVFIRDDRGYVGTWLDGTFVQYSRDRNTDILGNTSISLGANNLAGYTLALDDIAVYDGVFLVPNAAITYASGTITVNDYDVGLQKIADAVGNPAVFSYDPGTKTAVCNADILIKSGAELEITDATLKMVGGKKLKYEREAMIFLEGATIQSTSDSPWYWELSGSSNYGAVVFSVVDSTVDNCGGFYAASIKCLYLKDSRFTNLVGTNPIYIRHRRPPNGELLISFEGQQSNWFKGLADVNNHPTTTTGADGHTPLPSDTDGTIVITHQRLDGVTPVTYTYTVAVEKGAAAAQVTGVSPDETWYRSDPSVPAETIVVVLGAGVRDRCVFYNNSAFDGNDAGANPNDDGAIATDKTALLTGQTASFANYTSYSRGINGIMVDIAGLTGTPTASDFAFKVGNDNNPAAWTTAPVPTSVTVRSGAGTDGSDRVTIVWPDNAIEKQWLQATVKATTNTGLVEDYVFYFGNAIGETGDSPTDANVTPTDQVGVRNNPHSLAQNPADIDDAYDFNRDRKVGPTDELISRSNGTNSSTALQLITAP